MKYKIEKNSVQETLILPLCSRKLCTELYPNLYRDETAVHLIDQIDYDFSEAEKNSRSLMQRFGALEVAMRQNDLAFEVQAYLKNHPCAAVVNLGCGLDNTGRACENVRSMISVMISAIMTTERKREWPLPFPGKRPLQTISVLMCAGYDKTKGSSARTFVRDGTPFFSFIEKP